MLVFENNSSGPNNMPLRGVERYGTLSPERLAYSAAGRGQANA
jgi:hypothetical protein